MEENGNKMTILKASAGSGKTYTLAYRFIRKLIENPQYVSHMLAVTFTNKATCQMKEKILESLQNLREDPENAAYTCDLAKDLNMTPEQISSNASRAQLEILSDYDGFAVSTIDKFFNRVVRSFFNELRKDPQYQVVTSTTELMDRAILNVVMDPERSAVLEPLFIQRTMEDGKNSDIRRNLQQIRGAILKLHDAGYDIGRIRSRYEADRRLLSGQTAQIRQKARQMLGYMLGNGITAEDYYNSGRGFISQLSAFESGVFPDNAGEVILSATFTKIASGEKEPAKAKSLRRSEIESMSWRIQSDCQELAAMAESFDSRLWCTVSLLSERINMLETIKVIYDQYIADCEKDNVIAISEMPALVSKIARNSDLQFLYMKLGTLLETVMIDEFQDTSTEQWEGFRPILEEIFASVERPENLIIGDIKQAIYRWRNGNEALLRSRVAQEFPQAYPNRLEKNYRSREAIVAFNNALYTAIAYGKDIPIEFEGIEDTAVVLRSVIFQTYGDSYQLLGNPARQTGGYVECSTPEIGTVPEEVTSLIKERILTDGYSYGDIAVIIRRNSEAETIAKEMVDAGIPFISGESLRLSSALSVKKMMALMHIAADRRDTQSIASYNCLAGRGPSTALPDSETAILAGVSAMSLVEAAAALQREFGITTDGETAYFDAFMDKVYTRYRDKSDSVADFVRWWDDSGKESKLTSPEGQNAVTIITIHQAKGLEYPVVIAPYVNWDVMPIDRGTVYLDADDGSPYAGLGTFPLGYSEKKMAGSHFRLSYLAEAAHSVIDNLNLLYVTTTRACDRLYMFCPARTKQDAHSIRRFISQYLDRLASPSGHSVNSLEAITGKPFDNDCAFMTDVPFEYMSNGGSFSFKAGKPAFKPEASVPATGVLPELVNDVSAGRFEGSLTTAPVLDPSDRRSIDRQKGMLMHRALSTASSLEDLEAKVREEAKTAGVDVAQFLPTVERILSRPEMREWFSPHWEVFCERGIMIPGSVSGRRPDRVLVKGNKAVVIDYKFGTLVLEKYVDQVREYMGLLVMMGYPDVTGCIYYVLLDRIVHVYLD